jgi:L-ribulose-5-phosphate 3-epimerase
MLPGEPCANRGLGCYINPIHPEDGPRSELLRFFKDHLRYVGDMGGSLVGLETGTPNAAYGPDPRTGDEHTFQALVRSIAELVEEAEYHGVKVAVEAVTHHTISTPAKMKRLLDEIRSPNLVVIHDPVNLISSDNYQDQDRLIEEPFQLYGDKIAIIHAKDFSITDGTCKQMATGFGQLNYNLLCRLICQHKPGILQRPAGGFRSSHCGALPRSHPCALASLTLQRALHAFPSP